MGYKIKGAFKKSKPVFIVTIILWIILSIVFVAPVSVSLVDAKIEGTDFFTILFSNFSNVISNLGKIFKPEYIHTFGKGELYLGIILLFFASIGFSKSMPKNEYTNIEHGSSDWAEHGEQYSVLSNNKGILLAEKNYLPVNKRGNINVMVVGRFWFW